jgi:hypothetical protein
MIERYEGGVKLVFNTTKDLLEYEANKESEKTVQAVSVVLKEAAEEVKPEKKSDQWNTRLKTSHNNYVLHGKLKEVMDLYSTMRPSAIGRELGLKKSTVLSYISLLRRKQLIV